jgi:hypothetical protein
VFLVVIFIQGEKVPGENNILVQEKASDNANFLAQASGSPAPDVCQGYNTGAINRPGNFPSYSSLLEQSWTWRRANYTDPTQVIDIGGPNADYTSLVAAFAAVQSGQTIVVHALPANELDGFPLQNRKFTAGNPVHIYFDTPISVGPGGSGGDVINIDNVENLVIDGMNNLRIYSGGVNPRAGIFIGHQTVGQPAFTSTVGIVIKNLEVDGGRYGTTATGLKWGLFGDGNTDTAFCNLYVHNMNQEHAFYFHDVAGNMEFIKNRTEYVGRTCIQIRSDWYGNPNARYIYADNWCSNSCQGGALTADDVSGTWWIHGNTILDSIGGITSSDSLQQGYGNHTDGHVYIYNNKILMRNDAAHSAWGATCNSTGQAINLTGNGASYYLRNNLVIWEDGTLGGQDFIDRDAYYDSQHSHPPYWNLANIVESDNNTFGLGKSSVHTGNPATDRMGKWGWSESVKDAPKISVNQWKTSMPNINKPLAYDTNSQFIWDPTTIANLIAQYFGNNPPPPPPPTPSISVSMPDSSAGEPSNNGTFRITRSIVSTSALPITISFSGSTATAGSDYQTIATTQTIPANATTLDIPVTIINDTAVEGSENLVLTVASGSGYNVGSPSSQTMAIGDDDSASLPTVSVSVLDAAASETGPDTGAIRLTRTGSTAAALTVNFTVSGSATNGTDYQTIATSKIIPAGSATADVTVTPIDDTSIEPTESVSITLSASAAYTVGTPSSGSVDIADNDTSSSPIVSVSVTDATATEAGPTGGTIRISRTTTTGSINVNILLSGSATSADYQPINLVQTIGDGVPSVTVNILPIDDALVEGAESVVLTIQSGTGYSLGGTVSGTVNITDNDSAPPPMGNIEIKRVGSDLSVSSAPSTNATVDSLPLSSANPATFSSLNVGTHITYATDAAGYTESVGLCSFPIGGAECSVTTFPTAPTCSAGMCSITTSVSQNMVTKVVFQYLPIVTVAATDAAAGEGATPDTGTFTITRGGSTASALTVSFAMSGIAANGTDYATISSPRTIPAGSSSATVTVTPINDTVVEPTETVILTLAASTLYDVGSQNSAIVNIADDDSGSTSLPTVTIAATDAAASETGPDTGTFTITRTGANTAPLSVKVIVTGIAGNNVDYTSIVTPQIIPAGLNTVTVSVTPIDDTLLEGTEDVILTLDTDAAYTIGNPSSATVLIADNEAVTTSPPAPGTSTSCVSGSPQVNITWDAAGNAGLQGYYVNIDVDNVWTNGYFTKFVATGTTNTIAPNGFTAVSPLIGALSLNAGTSYPIRIFYPATSLYSLESQFIPPDCSAPNSPPPPPPPPPPPSGSNPPSAPSGLTGVLVSPTAIRLAWIDNSSDESGFVLERKMDTSSFTVIANLSSNITNYDDVNLASGTNYTYRVSSWSSSGTSYSSSITVTTPGDAVAGSGAVPEAPTSLIAYPLSTSHMRIFWTAKNDSKLGYRIERSTDGVNFSEVRVAPPHHYYWNDTGLSTGTSYTYRVRAYNASGNSAPSTTFTAKTFFVNLKPIFPRTLAKGSIGYDVTLLQIFLSQNKSIYPEGVISGYFGSLTEIAVKKFQNKYGISPIGIVGPKTSATIDKIFFNPAF